jgi:CDP-diacylglycerol--glycerol-3-phosphate 3-phosphatidyltransferase
MLERYRTEIAYVAEPVARAMVRLRFRPNQLSWFGLVCSVAAALAFAFDQPRLGALWFALAGVLDMLDGAVARVSSQASPFGAFLDAVIDRYSDLLVLGGIVLLFARLGRCDDVAAALLALIGTVMVSYTRACAESLGVGCEVGFMERGERMLVLIIGALAGLLVPALWTIALGANLTAVHRIVHTQRVTR